MLRTWGNMLASKVVFSKSSFLKAKPGLIKSLDTTQVPGETVSRGLRNNIFIYPSKHICVINTETPNKQRSYLYIEPDLVFIIKKNKLKDIFSNNIYYFYYRAKLSLFIE
jgi:hypothetical protein